MADDATAKGDAFEVDMTTAALASVALTSSLVRELLTSGQFDAQRMHRVFEGAAQELARMTTPLAASQADLLLRLFWPDYRPEHRPGDLN